MAQCTAKSKRSGEQCRKRAVNGSTKCHMHGGKTPSKHGGYSKMKMIEEDISIDDPISILQDQLKEAIRRYKRIKQADDSYYSQREKNDLNGLDLTEISQGGDTPEGGEYKTIHRKRDFSTELNAAARLIKELTKAIQDMKKDMGIVDSNDKIVFDINFG